MWHSRKQFHICEYYHKNIYIYTVFKNIFFLKSVSGFSTWNFVGNDL